MENNAADISSIDTDNLGRAPVKRRFSAYPAGIACILPV